MHVDRTCVRGTSCTPLLPLLLALLCLPGFAAANPCVQPDASGTVFLPPSGTDCPYIGPAEFHLIVDGLAPGDSLVVGVEHAPFDSSRTNRPGGSLGGEIEEFQSGLHLEMHGTGSLAGFSRTLDIVAACETHVGPRIPGAPVQSFDTDMFLLQGQLPPGDPDFDLLRVTAGTGFGMPSPGHTTLTQLPGGQWNVDSFFDITYRIDFVGAPGGLLAGRSGSTTATIRMATGEPVATPPCTVVDNGTGTVSLPPAGCGYVSPADLHMMIDGLPPGTTIEVAAEHRGFFNSSSSPGGTLGGEVEDFQSFLQLELSGSGELATFQRNVMLQAQCQTHTAPRVPGNPVQSFDTDMFLIQGQLPPGDPDFDLLRITAGTGFGMPSPGHTTLTVAGPAEWNVDSFFDITYRIDFVGAPGGPLGGMSGSTTSTLRMQTGQPAVTGVPQIAESLADVTLSSRPNPFSGAGTSIEFRLPATAEVRLAIYDVAGQLVRTLTNERTPAGPHAMFWDGRDNAGRKLGTGVYFAKIEVGGKTAGTTKITVVK